MLVREPDDTQLSEQHATSSRSASASCCGNKDLLIHSQRAHLLRSGDNCEGLRCAKRSIYKDCVRGLYMGRLASRHGVSAMQTPLRATCVMQRPGNTSHVVLYWNEFWPFLL